jgi:hypothetical protein
MDFTRVEKSALKAIEKFLNQNVVDINEPFMQSIPDQLKFIADSEKKGKIPRNSLPEGKTFTYGIISSREFASPEELELNEYLTSVGMELYPEEYSNQEFWQKI